MGAKKIISCIFAVILTVGFVLPADVADAFEQHPRSLRWELVSQSGEKHYDSDGHPYAIHRVEAGEVVNMSVTVRNRSRNRAAEMWYGKHALLDEGPNYPNAHAIGLGTWAPMDHIPYFLGSSSFVINDNRFAYYDGDPINKGQSMTLNFQVKIKEGIADGTYDLVTSFVREFDEWGWRDNGHGQNHRYRSMLWKFVVGDEYDLQTASQYSADFTTPADETDTTIYFKDSSGGHGHPLDQEDALQFDRELRWRLGYQNTEDGSGESMIKNEVVGIGSEFVFMTWDYGDVDIYSYPIQPITRIYGYNSQTRELRLIYTHTGSYAEIDILHPAGVSGTNLIVYKMAAESSPGPCFSSWLDLPHFSIDVSQGNPTIKPWTVPQWKMNESLSQLDNFCLEQR